MTIAINVNAFFAPPSPEEPIPVPAQPAPAQSPQAEPEPPIVVRAAPPAEGAPTPTRQSPRKKTPCLQLPVFPAEASGFHRPRTIEEYKALLVLATRSTWTDRFSEADYLKMERWVGMDKYRPKVPTRICKAVEEAPKASEADTFSEQENPGSGEAETLAPATSSMPTVVVPADPNSRKSKTPAPRTRGTYQ